MPFEPERYVHHHILSYNLDIKYQKARTRLSFANPLSDADFSHFFIRLSNDTFNTVYKETRSSKEAVRISSKLHESHAINQEDNSRTRFTIPFGIINEKNSHRYSEITAFQPIRAHYEVKFNTLEERTIFLKKITDFALIERNLAALCTKYPFATYQDENAKFVCRLDAAVYGFLIENHHIKMNTILHRIAEAIGLAERKEEAKQYLISLLTIPEQQMPPSPWKLRGTSLTRSEQRILSGVVDLVKRKNHRYFVDITRQILQEEITRLWPAVNLPMPAAQPQPPGEPAAIAQPPRQRHHRCTIM